jgi:hypothetical protein
LVLLGGTARGQELEAQAGAIRRLDGSTISIATADSFARKILKAAHVTGAQIVVMDRGRLVWSAAYGLRRRQPELPMDRETTMWAASITKGVFATYVMQLVERGEFDLDRPIASQLPQPLNSYDAYKETASEIVKDPSWSTVRRACCSRTPPVSRISRSSNPISDCTCSSNRGRNSDIRERE